MFKRTTSQRDEEQRERPTKRPRILKQNDRKGFARVSASLGDKRKATTATPQKRSASERDEELYEPSMKRQRTRKSGTRENPITISAEARTKKTTVASAARKAKTASKATIDRSSKVSKASFQRSGEKPDFTHRVPGLEDFFGSGYLSTIGQAVIGDESRGGLSRKDVRNLGLCSKSLRNSIYDKRNLAITLRGSLCDELLIEPISEGRQANYCPFMKGLCGRLFRCQGLELGLETALKEDHGPDFWICETCAFRAKEDFNLLDSIPFFGYCKPYSSMFNTEYCHDGPWSLEHECKCDEELSRSLKLCSECQLQLSGDIRKQCVDNFRGSAMPLRERDLKTMTFSCSPTGVGLRELRTECGCGKSFGGKIFSHWNEETHLTGSEQRFKVCLRCLKPKQIACGY